MKTRGSTYSTLYLALMGTIAICHGQVVLTPATIFGDVGYTNTGITAGILLGEGMLGCSIMGASTNPPGLSADTSCAGVAPLVLGQSYTLTVESAGGVFYNLTNFASLYTGGSATGIYRFVSQNGIGVTPNAAVSVDFKECAGIIDFKIGSNACATPASVDRLMLQTMSPARLATKSRTGPVSQTYFIVPVLDQQDPYPIEYFINSGTNPFSNQIQVRGETIVTPQCDIVTPVCIDDPSPSPGPGTGAGLGEIVGKWDVVGEFEAKFSNQLTRLYAFFGPDGNFRLDTIPGTNFTNASSSPINPPWQLGNLPAGPYRVGGVSLLRSGRAFNLFAPESLGDQGLAGVTVNSGMITDLGDTFVMTPGYFFGDILLADPFTSTNGTDNGKYSGLRYLLFNADQDSNNDGIPDDPFIGQLRSGSFVGAVADSGVRTQRAPTNDRCSNFIRSSGIGCSQTAWPHVAGGPNGMPAFMADQGEFSSNYELVIANANDQQRLWQTQRLHMVIQTLADPSDPSNPNNLPNPQRSVLDITDGLAPTLLTGPGDRNQQDFKYCFGNVDLNLSVNSGNIADTIFRPNVSVSGQFIGANFMQQTANYQVNGIFNGTPVDQINSSQTALVSLTLPEGNGYEITPTVQSFDSASGRVSITQFVRTTFDLGCGQRINLVPGLSVSVNPLPQCAPASGLVDISGSVKSSGEIVNRIYYTLNGGPEIDICPSNCGTDPSFTTTASVANGTNTIKVFVTAIETVAIESQIEFGTTQCAALPCDVDGDRDIDKLDLSAISRARRTTPQPADPRDANNDGIISPADVKFCIPKCTLAHCAIQ